MQPSNGGLSYIHHHHHQQQERQQHSMEDDCCCSPSVLQNLNHPCLSHLQQEQHKQPHQVFLQQHHQLFYPFQQLQQQQEQQSQGQGTPQNPSLFTMSFKLGRNEGSGNRKASALNNQDEVAATPTLLDGNEHINPPHAILMPRSWHPLEDYTTIKEPFW